VTTAVTTAVTAAVAAGVLPLVITVLVAAGHRLTRPPRRVPAGERVGASHSRKGRRGPERPDGAIVGGPDRLHRRRVVARVVVGLGAVVATLAAGLVVGVGTAVLGMGVAPRWRALRRTRAAARSVAADLPDTVDLLVALVRAGLTPMQAIAHLAQRAPPSWQPGFAAVDTARTTGERFVDALDALVVTLGPPARPLADALSSAERYGHPLGPVLERLSDEGRAARRRLAETEARHLPVRLSFPLVCCTLPSFVLLTIAPLLAGAFGSLQLSGGSP